jgi:hypothetical protein
MKNKFLRALFVTSVMLFFSCEDDYSIEDVKTSEVLSERKYAKRISYEEFKNRTSAYDAYQNIKENKLSSINGRSVYNEDYGLQIDTSHIYFVDAGAVHSLTFEIIDENLEPQNFKNLVLTSKPDGRYSAFVLEYVVDETDINNIINDQEIGEITPISVTDLNSTNSFTVEGDCVESVSYTHKYCYTREGDYVNLDNDTSGALLSTCKGGTEREETYQILVIDMPCLTGGGGGGGSTGGGYPGYTGPGVPGGGSTGGGSTGGGGYWCLFA